MKRFNRKPAVPDDDGHPVQAKVEVVQYQDGLTRILVLGEVKRDALMRELRDYLYRGEPVCPVCGQPTRKEGQETP